MLKSEELAGGDEDEDEDEDDEGDEREPWNAFPPCPPMPNCSALAGRGSHSNIQGNHRIIKEDANHLARQEKPWVQLSLLIDR